MALGVPPEVLAACFRFLSLLDLVTASHVSHDWRTTALAFPDLWATILSDLLPLSLIAVAQARSGNASLSIEIVTGSGIGLAPILAPYVHRMRSFIAAEGDGWDLKLLERPAPMLEQLDFPCMDPITQDFLGGRAGSLKDLRLFALKLPPTGLCPALSCLTNLKISSPSYRARYGPLDRPFELCPLLERLQLDELTDSIQLPPGPAPRTLRALSVSTTDPECCLLSVMREWRADTLAEATLKFSRNSLTPESSDVLCELVRAGLVELEICLKSEMVTVIRAVDSRKGVLQMTVLHAEVVRHLRPVFVPLFKHCEGTLRTLAILDSELPELKLPIPSLETLTLGVYSYAGVTKGFQWERLRRLAQLGPGRVGVTMEIRTRKRLVERDVGDMMENLAFAGENVEGNIDMTIVMHHTAQTAVRQVGLPDRLRFTKLGVRIIYGTFHVGPDWHFQLP